MQLLEYKRSKNAADDTGVSSLPALVFALYSTKAHFDTPSKKCDKQRVQQDANRSKLVRLKWFNTRNLNNLTTCVT